MKSRQQGTPEPPDRSAYIGSPLPHAAELDQLFPGKSAEVIFDVGSCEGEDAIRYARFFPSATVHAFEPVPQNVALIRENIARYGPVAVEVHEFALSDEIGRAPMYVSRGRPNDAPASDWNYGNKSSSLLPPDRHLDVHPWVHFDRVITVQTDTIAHFCELVDIERIDLLHLDVQGAELRVLDGAGDMLTRLRAVWMEVEAVSLYKDQPLRSDVERFMALHGFRLAVSRVDSVSGDQLYYRPPLVRGHGPLLRLQILARSLLKR